MELDHLVKAKHIHSTTCIRVVFTQTCVLTRRHEREQHRMTALIFTLSVGIVDQLLSNALQSIMSLLNHVDGADAR